MLTKRLPITGSPLTHCAKREIRKFCTNCTTELSDFLTSKDISPDDRRKVLQVLCVTLDTKRSLEGKYSTIN